MVIFPVRLGSERLGRAVIVKPCIFQKKAPNPLGIMQMKRGRAGVEYEDTELGDGSTAKRGCTVDVKYSLFLNRGDQVQKDMHY